jgi:polyisoprenoid-binding protein YceI
MPLLHYANRFALVLLSVTLLAACTAPPTNTSLTATPPQSSPPTAAPPLAVARQYRIEPANSKLHILVYRGGTMARLGHNHVVSSRNLSGSIWQGTSLDSSGFDIAVPVNDLVVDDNTARTAEGEDFPLNVSDDAKQSTKANMLRDTLLDGARYPEIRITAVRVQGDAIAPVVIAALRIRDQTRQVTVPVTLHTTDTSLQVRGAFEIKQSDFGITPLSIAMGALQVVDTLKIKFVLVAIAD